MNQPVNLQDRRQERTVQKMRVLLVTEILVGGQWIRYETELNSVQAAAVAPPAQAKQPGRSAPSMTHGRDPAKHLLRVKKFNSMTIEQADNEFGQHELADYADWGRKQKDMSPTLEVDVEMIEAYLIEREYDPSTRPEKYKSPRRQ